MLSYEDVIVPAELFLCYFDYFLSFQLVIYTFIFETCLLFTEASAIRLLWTDAMALLFGVPLSFLLLDWFKDNLFYGIPTFLNLLLMFDARLYDNRSLRLRRLVQLAHQLHEFTVETVFELIEILLGFDGPEALNEAATIRVYLGEL